MLAIVGGAAGIGIAKLILKGILVMIPVDTLPSEADIRLNLPVLLFMLVAAILSERCLASGQLGKPPL